MLVQWLSVATPAVHTLTPKPPHSARPKVAGNADIFEAPTSRAMGPLRGASITLAAPHVSHAEALPEETLQEALDDLTAQFKAFALRGRYGCAFHVLRKLKNHSAEIVDLPAPEFKQAFRQFASLTQEPRSEVAEWLVDLGIVRLEHMAAQHVVTKRGAAGLSDVHAAVGDALLGWELYSATNGGDGSGKNFWSSMELTLGCIWQDIAISQRDGDSTHGDDAASCAAKRQFLEAQITALSTPFAESGRATTGLVHRFIETIADTWPERSIAMLPWLVPIAAEHRIGALQVEALVLQKATSHAGRGNLARLQLESFSPELAEKLCVAFAKNLMHEARSMPLQEAAAGFPLAGLAAVPQWLSRLALSAEARNDAICAIEQAVALMEQRFVNNAPMAASLRCNHAAWLFVSGLRPQVKDANHLASIVAGLQAQNHRHGWPWELPIEAQGATFAAVAKAAREAKLGDSTVRKAWEATKAAAQTAAKACVADAQHMQAQAAKQLVEARERAHATKQSTADATDALRRIRATSVDWNG